MARAYALGSMPGTSIEQVADVVASETPDVIHIPVLPERGAGADAIGRTMALMEGLFADVGVRGWVLTPRPQKSTKYAKDLIARDLDVCEELWSTKPESIKISVVGPWTLATSLEVPGGYLAITDEGARRDLTEGLTHALTQHVHEIQSRFEAKTIIQLDEPLLTHITEGKIQGPTRFDPVRKVHPKDVAQTLDSLASDFSEELLLNLSGQRPLFGIAHEAGVDGIQIDLAHVSTHELLDQLGEFLSGGKRVAFGIQDQDPWKNAQALARLMDKLSVDPALLTTADVFPDRKAPTILEAAKDLEVAYQTAHILSTRAGDL